MHDRIHESHIITGFVGIKIRLLYGGNKIFIFFIQKNEVIK